LLTDNISEIDEAAKGASTLAGLNIYRQLHLCTFLMNTISAFGCGLLASGVGIGYWIYGFTKICYHSFYPPFAYVTFLAGLFQEEDLHLKDVYYSKLKDFMGSCCICIEKFVLS
jgi:FtsH-binding integral membrane protein